MTDTNDTVLVTGGTGTLGRHVARVLEERGYVPRVMSRSAPPGDRPRGWEWARADLATGDGLQRALEGVDAVLHAATSSTSYRKVDVAGTREHLVPAARSAGVRHLVFPSIVGADQIPFGYYDAKVEVEEALHASDVPTTVARATQFHSFVHPLIRGAGRLPVMPLPTEVQLQTVYAGDFAGYLVDQLEEEPGGRAPDFAGPDVRTLGEMAEAWAELHGRTRWTLRLPLPGSVFDAFREGRATNPERAAGSLGWERWLSREAREVAGGGRRRYLQV